MLPNLTCLFLGKVNKYMNSEELDPDSVAHSKDVRDAILVDNASFKWDKTQKDNNLVDINVRVKEGTLVAIVGQVGSGKSSLISALLGEMDRTAGVANTKGKIAYVPQQAWIQNGTVQYNITFGKKFNQALYDR